MVLEFQSHWEQSRALGLYPDPVHENWQNSATYLKSKLNLVVKLWTFIQKMAGSNLKKGK
jgi:hypothetical protein